MMHNTVFAHHISTSSVPFYLKWADLDLPFYELYTLYTPSWLFLELLELVMDLLLAMRGLRNVRPSSWTYEQVVKYETRYQIIWIVAFVLLLSSGTVSPARKRRQRQLHQINGFYNYQLTK